MWEISILQARPAPPSVMITLVTNRKLIAMVILGNKENTWGRPIDNLLYFLCVRWNNKSLLGSMFYWGYFPPPIWVVVTTREPKTSGFGFLQGCSLVGSIGLALWILVSNPTKNKGGAAIPSVSSPPGSRGSKDLKHTFLLLLSKQLFTRKLGLHRGNIPWIRRTF